MKRIVIVGIAAPFIALVLLLLGIMYGPAIAPRAFIAFAPTYEMTTQAALGLKKNGAAYADTLAARFKENAERWAPHAERALRDGDIHRAELAAQLLRYSGTRPSLAALINEIQICSETAYICLDSIRCSVFKFSEDPEMLTKTYDVAIKMKSMCEQDSMDKIICDQLLSRLKRERESMVSTAR